MDDLGQIFFQRSTMSSIDDWVYGSLKLLERCSLGFLEAVGAIFAFY